jgi:hypothetical protein
MMKAGCHKPSLKHKVSCDSTISACDSHRDILGRIHRILTVCAASIIMILNEIMARSTMSRRHAERLHIGY